MATVQPSHIDATFGRLHRGLKTSDTVDWKETKGRSSRRSSTTWKKIPEDDVRTSVSLTPGGAGGGPGRVLEADGALQLTLKANSVLGQSKWSVEGEFVKLDKDPGMLETEGAATTIPAVNGGLASSPDTGTTLSPLRECSVFTLTETEKYILKQIMNLTQDRTGLQAHRNLAETHLIRVQTHMEEPLGSEISEGGYIHLPDRTKMKRHYMKKLGRKATKTEVRIPKEYCSIVDAVPKYDPVRRRADLKNTIIPLVKGALPPIDFRFRHLFVVDMEVLEDTKMDLNTDRIPVYPASHPGDRYFLSNEVSEEVKRRSKRLLAGIRIAFNNRLYWKDVMKGKSKPSSVLEDCETEQMYRDECARFLYKTLDCKSMMYYIDIFDEAHEYDLMSQGYVGTLENSPRMLAVDEGDTFNTRLLSHLEKDSNLFESSLSLPRLWRHNFFDGKAGHKGILQRAPSILIIPLDFGLHGGQTKTKQTDRLRYLEARYLKYFGGVSPVTLNDR